VILTVPIPENPELVEVDLIASVDRSDTDTRRTAGLVSVGLPLVVPLDLAQISKNSPLIAAYVRENKKVHIAKALALPCSFTSGSHPLISAAVAVSLICESGVSQHEPIAWCLDPRQITKPIQAREMKLSFDLAIPPKFGMELGDRYPLEDDRYILLAHGEGTSTPEWWFRRTRHNDFDGIHWLGMMILLPRNEPATARLALTAAVRHRKLGFLPYSAHLPEQVRQVTLSA
jgi:hypothetical protein